MMAAASASTGLQLVPTDDLWHELCSRFRACILVVQTENEKEFNERLFFHGGWAVCIGLCEMLKAQVLYESCQQKEFREDE